MKAVIFDGSLKLVNDWPKPEPGPGEALIKVRMSGICNTDLEILKGYLGFAGVIGHEFTGIVEAVNGKQKGLVGKRVVGEINCGCGACDLCRKGLERHCPERTTLGILGRDGALAEYTALPASNLHMVPDELADEEAVFTEPLAAAFEILEQVHVRPADRVLVMGDGKLGILCALTLRLTGAGVSLAGKHPEKMKIAVAQGVQGLSPRELDQAKKYDIVVEATGRAEVFESAMKLVRPRGTIVLKSTVAQGVPVNLAPLVIDEINVVGSRCGLFAPALKALDNGLINVKPLISAVFSFAEAKKAFAAAKQRNSLKVLIRP